jgi:hypothetical protein
MTTDQYFEQTEVLRLLVENLQANLDNMTDLSKEDKEGLMRVNLIMIRQALEDYGV